MKKIPHMTFLKPPIDSMDINEFRVFMERPQIWKPKNECCGKNFDGSLYTFKCPVCHTAYRAAKFGIGWCKRNGRIKEKPPLPLKSAEKNINYETKKITYIWRTFIWFNLKSFNQL